MMFLLFGNNRNIKEYVEEVAPKIYMAIFFHYVISNQFS